MGVSDSATAVRGREDNTGLAELDDVMTAAVEFAEKWPEAYRPRAFNLAVDRLISAAPIAATPAPGSTPELPATGGTLSAVARDAGIDAHLLARVVSINGDDGRVSIVGRIDGRTKADLAVQYAAVFCYIKERALNQLDTPIEELRALAKAHGCYDGANFTAAFRRSDSLRELGEAGARARTYRLSAKGVEEAKELLKKMVEV